jgi:hypothetical protein
MAAKVTLRETRLRAASLPRDPGAGYARKTMIAARPPTPYLSKAACSGLQIGVEMSPGRVASNLDTSYQPSNGISVKGTILRGVRCKTATLELGARSA